MKPGPFEITLPNGESVTAIAYTEPKRERTCLLVLAHGAGADQRHPFMIETARALCALGIDVVTFNFEYTEKKRKLPDRADKLEACYRAVASAVRARFGVTAIAIGGKSMGGRIASQIAAAGEEARALVLLGYPLHPPAKPEQLRDAHLPKVRAPMLFVQGERDAFGTPKELAPVLGKLGKRAEIFVVPGGDHSFHVPKKSGVQSEVNARIWGEIAEFLARN